MGKGSNLDKGVGMVGRVVKLLRNGDKKGVGGVFGEEVVSVE